MSYIVPLGLYHPVLKEAIHLKLYRKNETINNTEIFLGYNHKGIDK